MTEDSELIEKVAIAMWCDDMRGVSPSDWGSWSARHFTYAECARSSAKAAINVVRAHDAEKRAKIDEALAQHNESRHGGMSLYVETRRKP